MYGLERQINRPQFLIFIISFVSQDYSLLLWWWDGNIDYELPMKPFFIEIPNFWAWADNLGRYVLGHLGYFRPIYQHPF